jgi:hypothetical protein
MLPGSPIWSLFRSSGERAQRRRQRDENAVLRIEHDEQLAVLLRSKKFSTACDAVEFTFERFTDDRAVVVSEHEGSRCYWEHDALLTEDRMGSPERPVVMIWRYELTDGGRRLRATEQMRGGGRDQDNVWEFARQG